MQFKQTFFSCAICKKDRYGNKILDMSHTLFVIVHDDFSCLFFLDGIDDNCEKYYTI